MRKSQEIGSWCTADHRWARSDREEKRSDRPDSVPNLTRRFARWLAEREEVRERLGELEEQLWLLQALGSGAGLLEHELEVRLRGLQSILVRRPSERMSIDYGFWRVPHLRPITRGLVYSLLCAGVEVEEGAPIPADATC
jgi:hypothetical protein